VLFLRQQRPDKPHLLVHGTDLSPRHRIHLLPCLFNLLPMLPVYSVTYLAGLYRLHPSPCKGEGIKMRASYAKLSLGTALSAADEVDYLDMVARPYDSLIVSCPGHDLVVDLDGHAGAAHVQAFQQGGQRQVGVERVR